MIAARETDLPEGYAAGVYTVVAAIHVLNLIANLVIEFSVTTKQENRLAHNAGTWFSYLTSWGLLVYAAQSCYELWLRRNTSLEHQNTVSENSRLTNFTSNLAFLVMMLYWTAVYPAKPKHELGNTLLELLPHFLPWLTYSVAHSGCVLGNVPKSRFKHYKYMMGFGAAYVAWNAIYILALKGSDENGDPYLYTLLDWKKDAFLAFFIAVGLDLVGVPLLAKLQHTVQSMLFHCRRPRAEELHEDVSCSDALLRCRRAVEGWSPM